MKASLEALLSTATLWRAADREDRFAKTGLPTGFARLDAALAGGGWPLATVIELLLPDDGIGELSLLLPALHTLTHEASSSPRWVLWMTPPHTLYPPALAQAGLSLERQLLIRATSRSDRLWTLEQALVSKRCAAIVGWVADIDGRWLRRLNLAAQRGDTLTVLLRPASSRAQHSPATLRILLERTPRGLDLEIIKRRGGGSLRIPHVLSV